MILAAKDTNACYTYIIMCLYISLFSPTKGSFGFAISQSAI